MHITNVEMKGEAYPHVGSTCVEESTAAQEGTP